MSAISLKQLFDDEEWKRRSKEEQDSLRRLGIKPDPARRQRYFEIAEALHLNPDLRLDNLDKILPLPPEDLPEWRGIDAALTIENLEQAHY